MDVFSGIVLAVFVGAVAFFIVKALKGPEKAQPSNLNTGGSGGGQGSSPVKSGKEELK